MTGFEVITITFSFVLGLGVAQILSSTAIVIRDRAERPLHWMPLSVAAVSLLFHIQFWFALVQVDQVLDQWTWPPYAACLGLAVLLFLSGGIVLPSSSGANAGTLLEDFRLRGSASLLLLAAYVLAWIPCLYWFIGRDATLTAAFNLLFGVVAILAYVLKNDTIRTIAVLSVLALCLFGILLFWQTPIILE